VADISIKGARGGSVSAKGKINLEDVQFSFVRRGQTKDYRFDGLQADFISLYSKKSSATLNLEASKRSGFVRDSAITSSALKPKPFRKLKVKTLAL